MDDRIAGWYSLAEPGSEDLGHGLGSGALHRQGSNYKPVSELHVLRQRGVITGSASMTSLRGGKGGKRGSRGRGRGRGGSQLDLSPPRRDKRSSYASSKAPKNRKSDFDERSRRSDASRATSVQRRSYQMDILSRALRDDSRMPAPSAQTSAWFEFAKNPIKFEAEVAHSNTSSRDVKENFEPSPGPPQLRHSNVPTTREEKRRGHVDFVGQSTSSDHYGPSTPAHIVSSAQHSPRSIGDEPPSVGFFTSKYESYLRTRPENELGSRPLTSLASAGPATGRALKPVRDLFDIAFEEDLKQTHHSASPFMFDFEDDEDDEDGRIADEFKVTTAPANATYSETLTPEVRRKSDMYSSTDSTNALLVIFDVELPDGRSETVELFECDDPLEQANEFCRRWHIDSKCSDRLGAVMREHLLRECV